MTHYIDKDAVVAEITHKIKVLEAFIKNFDGISDKVEKAKNKIEALGDALLFIDSLQEEPAPKILEDMLNAKTAAESLGISQEEHDRIVDELIYGKEPELVDDGDLPEEEPVSEDLEKASKEWLTPQLDKSYAVYGEAKMMELTKFDGYAMLDAIEFGAKWQFERVNEALLSEVLPCFMHGGEADEVVAKLEEVLNQKK